MELDKPRIYHLGLVLGLAPHRVVDWRDNCASNLEFLDNVVLQWLRKTDGVTDVSWAALVRALLHPRLGQTGIATTIATKYGMYLTLGCRYVCVHERPSLSAGIDIDSQHRDSHGH